MIYFSMLFVLLSCEARFAQFVVTMTGRASEVDGVPVKGPCQMVQLVCMLTMLLLAKKSLSKTCYSRVNIYCICLLIKK